MRGAWTGLLAGAIACGGAAPAPLDQTATSEHYLYRFSAGDHVDAEWQESYHAWLVAALPVALVGKVEYLKYRDRAHLEALTGEATNGFADLTAPRFHTIWPHDNHEVVHALVVQAWGLPPALFTEGIAVAHQTDPAAGDLTPRWSQGDIHALTRAAAAAGRIPELARITTSKGFFDYDTQITYPMAGSFVRYLIDTRGLEPLQRLFRTVNFEAPASETETSFQAAYGTALPTAWQEWRDWLRVSRGVSGAVPPT